MKSLIDLMKKCGADNKVIMGLEKLGKVELNDLDDSDNLIKFISEVHSIWDNELSCLDELFLDYDLVSDNIVVRAQKSSSTLMSMPRYFRKWKDVDILRVELIEAMDNFEQSLC